VAHPKGKEVRRLARCRAGKKSLTALQLPVPPCKRLSARLPFYALDEVEQLSRGVNGGSALWPALIASQAGEAQFLWSATERPNDRRATRTIGVHPGRGAHTPGGLACPSPLSPWVTMIDCLSSLHPTGTRPLTLLHPPFR